MDNEHLSAIIIEAARFRVKDGMGRMTTVASSALEDVLHRAREAFQDEPPTTRDVGTWLSRLRLEAPHLFTIAPAAPTKEQALEGLAALPPIERLTAARARAARRG
jgi:hypothetical protein